MSQNFFKKTKNSSGFTLVETMIAVGLFAIVMMVGLAIITSLIDNNKKAQAINSVTSNLNFAIDSMVRDIKTGNNYHCGGTFPAANFLLEPHGCQSGGDTSHIRLISTLDNIDKYVMYEWVAPAGNVPGKITKTSCLISTLTSNCLSAAISGDITSSDINITDMKFIVRPGNSGTDQPSVFLIIKGTSAVNPTDASNFSIQTFISQRLLNI